RGERALQVRRPAVPGEDHDGAGRGGRRQFLRDRDAVQPRHLQVDDRDVGAVGDGGLDRAPTVPGLGDDLEVGLEVQQGREGGADQLLVVGEQYADHGSRTGSTASNVNTPSATVVRSRPPDRASRSDSPCSPELWASGRASPAPSLMTVSRTSSPVRTSSILHHLARLWRSTLVPASRPAAASPVATGPGSGPGSPSTVQRTPEEPSTRATASSWAARSTDR